jgi:type VI secretion system Hcp family effector
MAITPYLTFRTYSGTYLPSEAIIPAFNSTAGGSLTGRGLFPVLDYSLDIEQTLNIGSQSSGAGAGKITFNPFSITRKVDLQSPVLFQMSCSGTAFESVDLYLVDTAAASPQAYLNFTFKLAAIKTISWTANEGNGPTEIVTFEYGGLQVRYDRQTNGVFSAPIIGGWNRVTNTQDLTAGSNPIA